MLNRPLFYNIFQHLYESVLEAHQVAVQLFWEQMIRQLQAAISVKCEHKCELDENFWCNSRVENDHS